MRAMVGLGLALLALSGGAAMAEEEWCSGARMDCVTPDTRTGFGALKSIDPAQAGAVKSCPGTSGEVTPDPTAKAATLAITKAASEFAAIQSQHPSAPMLHQIGKSILTGEYNVFIGNHAGESAMADVTRTLLFGSCTAAPPHADGFVNIANALCFWRDTNERVVCPPPERGCEENK